MANQQIADGLMATIAASRTALKLLEGPAGDEEETLKIIAQDVTQAQTSLQGVEEALGEQLNIDVEVV